LKQDGQIIVGGRLTDTGLTLAPLAHEFDWSFSDWDKIAAGTIAGHIIECGAQASGGNCQYDWQNIPNLANVGFPIVEAYPDGEFVVTKHKGTGGRVNIPSVKEQLLYEMGDPKSYITPDVIADFSSIQLADDGPDRVRVYGVKGAPKTDFYKVSIAYSAGWKAVGTLVYAFPDAYQKAKAADKILRERLDLLGLKFEVVLTEFVGVNATHGHLAGEPRPDIPEVQLRIGVRGQNKADVERFTKELAPLILTGPPVVTGFAGGRPKVEEIMAYFPALLPKTLIEPKIEIIEA
ncbi:MAG TPA: acyclic terpene utilization AtuA family protein, partial [Pyrinomonadaceae bacterium]|nr:acyclic terpene utilization AtuA family protein [Pyrinomonadaceae bacterium]